MNPDQPTPQHNDDPPAAKRSKYATEPVQTSRMPGGIPYIIGNEAAERFSFYGMKAILTVFMTKHLLDVYGVEAPMSDEQAKEWVHNFTAAVYFFPIFGAILSDWLLGKYRTILALSMVYCAGHAVLACLDTPLAEMIDPRTILWSGLALISVGAGGIKPCVAAHVGDQFGSQNKHLISKIFGWFYFSVNLGSMTSTLLTPLLLEKFGPGWAFGVPGILMAIATFAFWIGRNKFVHIPPAGKQFFTQTFSREGIRAMVNLAPLFILIAPFWSLFDQTATAWVLQADNLNRVIQFEWFGKTISYEVLSSQLQAINPALIMIFIPLFSYVLYPAAGRLVQVTPLRKIGVGLFVMALAFMVPAWLESRISAGGSPHMAWHLVAYIILTGAEIMVSITALEFAYTQAPRKMKSFIMALYLLSISLGNKFTAMVNHFIQNEDGTSKLPGSSYYWFFVGVMLVTVVIYVVWSQFYRGQTYIQGEQGEH